MTNGVTIHFLSGLCDLPLWHFVGAKIDEYSSVPQTHCTEWGIACLVQRVSYLPVRQSLVVEHLLWCTFSVEIWEIILYFILKSWTKHRRRRAITSYLLLYLQSDQRSTFVLWVSTCNYLLTRIILILSPFNRLFSVDSPFSHILSASCAGFVSSTATNPIWFVKTRLQLDHDSRSKMNVRQCIQKIYETNGLRGFYKGITASYFGISETVVHFVIYEALKKKLVRNTFPPDCLKMLKLTLLRWICVKSDRTKAKRLATLLSSCLPEPLRRRSPLASHTHTRLRERDYAKRVTSIIASGRHFSWCGRKRARRDCTAASALSSFDKFPTQQSWWQPTRPSCMCCQWNSTRHFTSKDAATRTERVSSLPRVCASRRKSQNSISFYKIKLNLDARNRSLAQWSSS